MEQDAKSLLRSSRCIENMSAVSITVIAEKKQLWAHAGSLLNTLHSKIEHLKRKLDQLKTESFNIEYSLNESEIRVNELAKLENKLRENTESKRKTLVDLEDEQMKIRVLRDAQQGNFTTKLVDMSMAFNKVKISSQSKHVEQEIKRLQLENKSLISELHDMRTNKMLAWPSPVSKPLQNVEQMISSIRQLNPIVQEEVDVSASDLTEFQKVLDTLNKQQANLENQIDIIMKL